MLTHVVPEWATVSILFADIRGPRRGPRDSGGGRRLPQRVFGVVIAVVERHGRLVHQLLGDHLLALFGAPAPLADHTDCTLAAGAEMLDAVDSQFGERCRIGINSGLMLVGTIGGREHRKLGVIGDPCNVAARAGRRRSPADHKSNTLPARPLRTRTGVAGRLVAQGQATPPQRVLPGGPWTLPHTLVSARPEGHPDRY